MKIKTKTRIITFIFLIWIFPAFSQETNQENKSKNAIKPVGVELADKMAVILLGKRISLGDAIKFAIEQNKDIITGSYDVAMSDSFYKMYQKKYSPFLNVEGKKSYQQYPEDMGLLAGKDNSAYEVTGSIAKMFSTGTLVSAGIKHGYSNTTYDLPPEYSAFSSMLTPEYYQPIIFAGIQQELLQNFLGYNDRRHQEILKNESEIKKQNLLNMLSYLVVNVLADYMQLIVNKEMLNNANLQLQETKTVRNITAENARFGLAENYDLNFFNMLVASAEANALTTEQKHKDSLRDFLQIVNLGKDIKIEDSAILCNVLPAIDEQQALKISYEKRADYKNAERDLKNAQMKLEIHENEALPSLTAGVTANSMGQRLKMNDAYNDTLAGKYYGWEAAFALTYPLDDQMQKTNARDSRFKVKQSKINLDKTKRAVEDDITSKIENIKTAFNVYQKMSAARIEAEAYYKRIVENLRKGKITSVVVKNALDALVQNRQAELITLITFNVRLIQFDVAKNELFEIYNIDINKYIPKE